MATSTHAPSIKAPNRRGGLRFLLFATGLTTAFLLAFAAFRILTRQPALVMLVNPRNATLDIAHRSALQTLLQDQLECLGNLTVASVRELPSMDDLRGFSGRTLLVIPTFTRTEDRLSLSMGFTWLSDYRENPEHCWKQGPAFEGCPTPTIARALATLPLHLSQGRANHLLPMNDSLFWALLQGQALYRDESRLDEVQALATRITDAEPDCALAWILRGDNLYRRLLNDPRSHAGAQAEAESHFAKALSLFPHHPRGTFLLSELRIDAGDQRSALTELQAAIRVYPRATAIHSGIAYAARTAGLLELARRALARRDSLCPQTFTEFTSENTYLYLGDLKRFNATLVDSRETSRNAITRFYRGYLALMGGDRRRAQAQFLSSAQGHESLGQFRELSQAFAELTAGENGKAIQTLQTLETARAGLRVPDGEFTFKMAEAYALVGRRQESLDLLSRAFAQGFGCARWYAESPFLEEIRRVPRWRALYLHIEERQKLLEARFPASDFGL